MTRLAAVPLLLAACAVGPPARDYAATCTALVWSPLAEEEHPCTLFGPRDAPWLVVDVPLRQFYLMAHWESELEATVAGRPCGSWRGFWYLRSAATWAWVIRAACSEDGGDLVPTFLDVYASGTY